TVGHVDVSPAVDQRPCDIRVITARRPVEWCLGVRRWISGIRVGARGEQDCHDLRTVRPVAGPVSDDVQRCPVAMAASERTRRQTGIGRHELLDQDDITNMDRRHELISGTHVAHPIQIAALAPRRTAAVMPHPEWSPGRLDGAIGGYFSLKNSISEMATGGAGSPIA